MKKFLAFLLATFLCHFGYSQYVYTASADTVKFTNEASSTELIIENSTKNVPGFLYNKGNGKTEFRKILIPVSSNKYLLGSDTLDLSATGTGGSWGTSGTAGTTGGISFIGTTDNVPINFRVNNTLVGTIGTTANYNVSLGAASLPNTSTGIKNIALGGGTLNHNTTGFNNSAIGYTTLYGHL